jgi:hypothetical protein
LLNPDFRDMLSALSAEDVEYLLVGAYAMAVYGRPRATGDMDVLVRPTPENARRVLLALKRFGAPLLDLTQQDLETKGTVFQIGQPPRRIDIMNEIDGVGFDEAWEARVSREVDGVTVPVISREHRLRNKRAAGRPRDRADAAWLEEQDKPEGA